MRRRANIDANHQAIGDAAQQHGASVMSLAGEGKGCPDLLIGWRGSNYLWEVKVKGYDKKRGKVQAQTRARQIQWALRWVGQYAIVTSPDEAIQFLQQHK